MIIHVLSGYRLKKKVWLFPDNSNIVYRIPALRNKILVLCRQPHSKLITKTFIKFKRW
jgi:hypothetical protein